MNEDNSRANTTAASPLFITGTMLTHPGYVRANNEDVVAHVLSANARELLAIVADGMGGHLAGEVASRLAAETLTRCYLEQSGEPPERLAAGMVTANQAVYRRSHTDLACAGMGTTCTALAICDGLAFLGHIGDSRAYLWRDGTLHQVSEDHTLVAQMVRDGTISAHEAHRHPTRGILLKALGTHAECSPAIWARGMPLAAGDIWLLCSDGLSDTLDASVLGETIASLPPADACQALIDKALAASTQDNISAGVFGIEATSAGADRSS